jgi:hypothetical protein
MALLGPCDIATSSVSVRTTNGRAQALETAVNRYVALYLVTLIVIVPIDFLFLGIVAKGFFTSQVGDTARCSGLFCYAWQRHRGARMRPR